LIGHVGDAKEIDHCSDLDGWSQVCRSRHHPKHEREMPSGRSAGGQNPVGIDFVLRGVIVEPLRCLEHIAYRGGRWRRFGQPVFNIGHHQALPDERETISIEHALFVALNPASAVNENHAGTIPERGRARLQNVEHGFRIFVVTDVRFDLVIQRGSNRTKGEQ
jgi:hypothetical protein